MKKIVTTTLLLALSLFANSNYEKGLKAFEQEDYKEAVKWYELAAKEGHAQAQFELGAMYQHGDGVRIDFNKSEKWYKLAAEQGVAEAQSFLAFYYYSHGNEKDYPKALELFEKAAAQGDFRALNDLGSMYYYGMGVKVDVAKAYEYYKKSAEKKYRKAEKNIRFLCKENPTICK